MNFGSYLNQAWNEHGSNPQKVASSFSDGALLVESNEQLTQLVGLVTHVMGEHLSQWHEGVEFLVNLKNHPTHVEGGESEKAIVRSIAALQIGSGQDVEFHQTTASDQVRILTVAASALSEKETDRATSLLLKALKIAEKSIETKDPAHRALAITGNNLACALEEKTPRSEDQTRLMILAAQTGRKYWEIAGTWLEVSRAEYRLAQSFLKAQQPAQALQHAKACLKICKDNKAGALDLFFSYEVMALAEKALLNRKGFVEALENARSEFAKLNENDKPWCQESLQKLTNFLTEM